MRLKCERLKGSVFFKNFLACLSLACGVGATCAAAIVIKRLNSEYPINDIGMAIEKAFCSYAENPGITLIFGVCIGAFLGYIAGKVIGYNAGKEDGRRLS